MNFPNRPVPTDSQAVMKAAVGRRIVSVDPDKALITLDNGTTLHYIYDSDCCSWYEPSSVEVFDFEDNIITDIREVPKTSGGDYGNADLDRYDVVFLSNHKQLAKVAIEGDPTTGYYLTAGSVRVTVGGDQ